MSELDHVLFSRLLRHHSGGCHRVLPAMLPSRVWRGGAMADEMFSLEGRVAIVTGSGTGIGRATARVLAEHGADVVLAARRADLLEHTAASVRELHRRALVVPTDV